MNNSTMVSAKRLQSELADLILNPQAGFSAGPKGDNIYKWIAVFTGPLNSAYQGGTFFVDIDFSESYPFIPPQVTFRTRCYHPNVNLLGEVQLDILNGWSVNHGVVNILKCIYDLLLKPDLRHPLVSYVAEQFEKDRPNFILTATEWTRRFAL
jgi:ubiquitin-protein ligase